MRSKTTYGCRDEAVGRVVVDEETLFDLAKKTRSQQRFLGQDKREFRELTENVQSPHRAFFSPR